MTSLTIKRKIAARASIVFDALTAPEGISHWWGPDAGPVLLAETDVRVGGRFRVRFRTLEGVERESVGEYLEVEPPTRLAMSWRWVGGEVDPNVSRLEFTLRPVDGGVELTLTHSGLATDASAHAHEEGWSGALDKLERHFSQKRRMP